MSIVRRMTAVAVVLLALTSCASGANNGATPSSMPSAQPLKLPTCATVKLELEKTLPTQQPAPTTGPTDRAPAITSGPMQLCRYRPQPQGSVTLVLQVPVIFVSKTPASLLKTLNHLKTLDEVYGPGATLFCPMSQGAVDVVAIRETIDSKLTLIEVDRDGCHFITIDKTAYVSSPAVEAELDAL